jgi:hypothetical protein
LVRDLKQASINPGFEIERRIGHPATGENQRSRKKSSVGPAGIGFFRRSFQMIEFVANPRSRMAWLASAGNVPWLAGKPRCS